MGPLFLCRSGYLPYMNPLVMMGTLIMAIGGVERQVDLEQRYDLSLPLVAGAEGPSAWYVGPPRMEPVRANGWVGAVAEGGSVNFRDVFFNPHGHGTHTECVGHITEVVHSVNEVVLPTFMPALVISLEPEVRGEDRVFPAAALRQRVESLAQKGEPVALIVRTLPNDPAKRLKNWSNTNPTYFEAEGLAFLADYGVDHLLVDLPSVDREEDGGALAGHRAFWQVEGSVRMHATITEFTFVPDEVSDGWYALNLQTAAFVNDATPSRPLLHPLKP